MHLNRLFPFSFRIEKDGYNYTVGICVDTSKLLGNVSVTKSNSSYSLVLGRRNDTYVMGGGKFKNN